MGLHAQQTHGRYRLPLHLIERLMKTLMKHSLSVIASELEKSMSWIKRDRHERRQKRTSLKTTWKKKLKVQLGRLGMPTPLLTSVGPWGEFTSKFNANYLLFRFNTSSNYKNIAQMKSLNSGIYGKMILHTLRPIHTVHINNSWTII